MTDNNPTTPSNIIEEVNRNISDFIISLNKSDAHISFTDKIQILQSYLLGLETGLVISSVVPTGFEKSTHIGQIDKIIREFMMEEFPEGYAWDRILNVIGISTPKKRVF